MVSDKNKKSREGYLFALWGLAMHLIVLWGVLDANFHSPIIRGLPQVPSPSGAPAKRLFLFVADGLRYRTFEDEPAPFLKNVIMKTKGMWGVSHTRMPTESRPGNVAIAAGLYEDPSALFKGWKENPVDFDSVFNQSSVTWAWGSPDIVPMFVKGSQGNVHGESYPHEWQDFDKNSNTLILDTWVFDKYSEWLKEQAPNVKDQEGIILFFHLLGCDTAGHASKPHSKEYVENMRYVDEKIAEVVKSAEDFFKDNSTAYIFTADHGMTDWGSHGSGSEDETETPIVAWGAGLNHLNQRQDIEQADITPLISSLLGISIPANNEGILPITFLKSNKMYKVQALLSNIKQLANQVQANRIRTNGDRFSDSHWREQELRSTINHIEQQLNMSNINEALEEAEFIIEKCKVSLYHYRQTLRNQLIMYLTLMWLGWIVLLVLKLIGVPRQSDGTKKFRDFQISIGNVIYFVALVILLIEHNVIGRRDWRILGYGTIAFTSLWLAFRSVSMLTPVFNVRETHSPPIIPIIGIALLIITMSAGLINKVFFSLAMIITAVMQKMLMKSTRKLFICTALALAIYPAVPIIKPHPQIEIVLLSLSLSVILLLQISKGLIIMELIRLIVTILIITELIDGRLGVSWILLFSSPLSIFLYPVENSKMRLSGVTLGLLCPLSLLSASYEPQVFILLAVHLISLLHTLNDNQREWKKTEEVLTLENLVTATHFMLYILLSFFGTGNMASISSFDPMWTRHFITIFSPFTMSALILLKLGIPLILVGCASRVLASSSSMFLTVLLLGDCLSLPLMYSVTAKGSWLDIGTAISRYTIAITLPCLFHILYHLSSPLMTFSFNRASVMQKKHLV